MRFHFFGGGQGAGCLGPGAPPPSCFIPGLDGFGSLGDVGTGNGLWVPVLFLGIVITSLILC